MKKTGKNAFVCSFVFSLFMIFGINKAVRRDHQESAEITIPSKNIVLFLNHSNDAKKIKALPAKKITLTILPEITKAPTFQDTPQVVDSSAEKSVDRIIMASEDFDNIPLEIGQTEISLPAENTPKLAEAFPSPTLEAHEALPPAVYTPENIAEPAPKEIIRRDLPLTRTVPETIQIVAAEVEGNPLDNFQAPDSPTTFRNTEKSSDNEPNLLIPLEKSNGKIYAGSKEINIVTRADKNQVAMAGKKVPIKSMTTSDIPVEEEEKSPTTAKSEWQSMEELRPKQAQPESPWVVAKGSRHPKNNLVMEDPAAQKDDQAIRKILNPTKTTAGKIESKTQVASDMIDNILIPIPQDILDDDNLTPQLVSSEQKPDVEEEALKSQDNEGIKILDAQGRNIKKQNSENKGILSSITSMFSSSKGTQTDSLEDEEDNNDNFLGRSRNKKTSIEASRILPTEIRLSFQPNRAEISGSTLRWIHAFAKKAVEDATAALEIRIDETSDRELQQKRLNLLYNILTNKGVEYNKIKVVFTTREPNSFVIRTIRINEEAGVNPERNKSTNDKGYYMQW